MIDYLKHMRIMTSTLLDCIDTLERTRLALDNASPEMIQVLNCVVTSQNDTIQNLIKGLEHLKQENET